MSGATSTRSPVKDRLQPIVLVEDLPLQTKSDSDPESSTNSVTSTSGVTQATTPRRNALNSTASHRAEDLRSRRELLGSVTFAPIRSTSSTGPVRSSARVIQKMRQDNRPCTPPTVIENQQGPPSIASSASQVNHSSSACASATVNGSSAGSASASSAVNQVSGSGSTVATVATTSSSSSTSLVNGVATGTSSKSERTVTAPKTPTTSKQPKRLWSNMERGLFFEALNEYGKDFEAITQHINQKMRRKVFGAETSCKSREQVRHMYLQTFQKASRYLRFSEDVKKVPQELYALINYGEMRRKMPFMHEKAFMKLKELVYRGSVTIREKGKTIRIRTPSCRALRKLNQLEEWQEEVTLPQRIEVNLVPANMEAWGRVQSLAQNPRVKTTLPLYKRVSCLLKFLQNKWRSQELRLCEKTMSYQPAAMQSMGGRSKNSCSQKNASASAALSVDHHDLMEELGASEPVLCIAPPAKTIIHRPMVNLTDFSNSYSICLNSYEARIGAKVRGEELPVEKFLTHKERSLNGKRLRLDSGGEGGQRKKAVVVNGAKKEQGESNSDGETSKGVNGVSVLMDVAGQSEDELGRATSPVDIQMFDFSVIANDADKIDLFSDNSEDKKEEHKKSDHETEEKAQATSGARGMGGKRAGKGEKGVGSSGTGNGNKQTSFKPLIKDEVIRKIKEGWTITSCGDLTFGDLYVMFGVDFKINLEYKWQRRKGSEAKVAEEVKQELGTEVEVKEEEEEEQKVDKEMERVLGRRLGQLLMVANLMEKSLKVKKECVCDRGGRMKENDYPYPESNLFKHPALPLRYSHYNGTAPGNFNSMLQLRRQKPRQMYPLPSPKPFMSAPKYYHHHQGRPGHYGRPHILPQHHLHAQRHSSGVSRVEEEEAGQEGDAEDDGDEGSSTGTKRKTTEKVPVAVQTTTATGTMAVDSNGHSSAGDLSGDGNSQGMSEDADEEEEEDEEEEGEEEEDISKNPGLLSLLDISLPSIREEELLRATEMPSASRQGWLEDNMNDYSFSSLLGHIDMHLNSIEQERGSAGVAEEAKDSENGSTTGVSEDEVSPEKRGVGHNDMLSDRCSIISESSVDFVKKFAEMAGMIQDH